MISERLSNSRRKFPGLYEISLKFLVQSVTVESRASEYGELTISGCKNTNTAPRSTWFAPQAEGKDFEGAESPGDRNLICEPKSTILGQIEV